MIRYTIRRILWGLVVLMTLLVIVFVLFGPVLKDMKGASAASVICGPRCTPVEIKNSEHFLGLDKPIQEQFWIYLRRLVVGPSSQDFADLCPKLNGHYESTQNCVGHLGQSFIQQRSVDQIVTDDLPVTFSLTLVAFVFWLLIAFPTGVVAALKRGSFTDRIIQVFVFIGYSVPVYFIGLLALYLLTYKYRVFPSGHYRNFGLTNPWPWFYALILPSLILALSFAALYTRMIRSGMIGVLGEDYLRTARAKGVAPRNVVIKHGLRNVLLPIVTMAGLDLGVTLGGALLTEVTFGLHGIGYESYIAVQSLDVPLVSGIVLVGGALIVVANILVDLIYAALDPRIRLG